MRNDESVSIVIPVYNGSNYLKEAIDSALAQTYPNIEVLVVNDGSTDNGQTRNVALQYGDKIKYYEKENGYVASALNYGISKMTGNWFSWLSHDDRYLPNKIEKQMKYINNLGGKHIASLCSMSFIDKDGKKLFHPVIRLEGLFSGPELYEKYLIGYQLNGLGFLVKKSDLVAVGLFDTDLKYMQDTDMWVRLLQTELSFICIKDSLTETRMHENQDTRRFANNLDFEQSQYFNKLVSRVRLMPKEKREVWDNLLVFTYIKKGLYREAICYYRYHRLANKSDINFWIQSTKCFLFSIIYFLVKKL